MRARARQRDGDRNRARGGVGRQRPHVDRAEVAAVGERRVHVGEPARVVRLAFAERQVRRRELLRQHVLRELGAAERVARARVELERDVGGVLVGIDVDAARGELRVGIAALAPRSAQRRLSRSYAPWSSTAPTVEAGFRERGLRTAGRARLRPVSATSSVRMRTGSPAAIVKRACQHASANVSSGAMRGS